MKSPSIQPQPTAARPAAPKPPQPALPVARRGAKAVVMPLAVLAGSAGAAAFLHFGRHNAVMAGIVAAFGLVAATFTWIWQRH
jgi:hypothetical protein